MSTTSIPLRHHLQSGIARDDPHRRVPRGAAVETDCPSFVMAFAGAELHPVGTVVSVAQPGLLLTPAAGQYDRTAVGVVVEAFHNEDGTASARVAIGGVVEIRVCLDAGQITCGDLLVASDRAGIAVRARDHYRAIGAVVAKALEPVRWLDAPSGAETLIHAIVMR